LEDLSASGGLKFEPDPKEIGSAFHRASTDIGQISEDFERGMY